MSTRSYYILLFFMLMSGSLLFSLMQGSITLGSDQFNTIFFELRLPRTLSAFTSGGLLALAGALMQLLLLNPLADPYVLGISGGASCMTLLLMFLGMSEAWLFGGAWLGSLFTIMLIFTLTRRAAFSKESLILCGIVLACGFSACISFLLLLSQDTTLHSMLFWLSGDLNGSRMPWFGMCVLVMGFGICYYYAPGFNILSRGDLEAQSLGVSSRHYRLMLYLLSSLFTATAVTLAGSLGFVGLIVPHLARLLVGYDHRYVLPVSVFLGGSLLTFADTLARTLIAPQQLPVGILLSLIGVPIFISLLRHQHA